MGFDAKKCIKISNLDEAKKLRSELIKFIWKKDKIPSTVPVLGKKSHYKSPQEQAAFSRRISDRFSGMHNLKKVEEFTQRMEHDVSFRSYLYTPDKKSNKKLVIYNHGHVAGRQHYGKRLINFFLHKGYHVVAMAMPLAWPNSMLVDGAAYQSPVAGHNFLGSLETEKLCPIKFFVEPVCAVLNLLSKDFNACYMIGLSGGGWTTMVCAALDTRISQSFNVAGGLPVNLRNKPKDKGDWEQVHIGLYNIASYLDLYILGSIGKNRKCVLVFNKYDSCCFSGTLYEKWGSDVGKIVKKLGGHYEVYSDTTHKSHIISVWTREKIIQEIEG